MPIYEFICEDCNYKEDLIRKISEPTTILCPKCNGQNFVKQVSAPNFKLKGSGWYETDFKNTKNKKDTKNNNKIKEVTTKKANKQNV
jgi:putative FmdB family regulatory protein